MSIITIIICHKKPCSIVKGKGYCTICKGYEELVVIFLIIYFYLSIYTGKGTELACLLVFIWIQCFLSVRNPYLIFVYKIHNIECHVIVNI